ncbi:MAG: DUF2191 domain-containing protein [Gemmatimonadetes bacterium]|nr:DUF2191 domain-containing protein [Gemmatimonadota bacterium]
MRTTVTLDDDVAAKLKSEIRRTGKAFKQAVNDLLRFALNARRTGRPSRPFRVEARDLGSSRPGVNLDNVSELLEVLDGPGSR